jgi:hypothetical protein
MGWRTVLAYWQSTAVLGTSYYDVPGPELEPHECADAALTGRSDQSVHFRAASNHPLRMGVDLRTSLYEVRSTAAP